MIRGNLRILTLKALAKKPLSGYALMKYIEEKIGTKPSPGSMYPLLDDLTKERLVTKEGKEKLKITDMRKDILIKSMEESTKMWAELTGQDTAPFQETIGAMKKGKYSVEDIPMELAELEMEIARIFNQDIFKKNKKKIKDILKKSIKELKKI
jgi:DNA-binding PadR family transcriptional regulator